MGRLSAQARELSERLAHNVQAVCRHYLPAGKREGSYWMIGDVAGTPGRSLYVRLFVTGNGRAGNWVDAATGEFGDLLDLIRINMGFTGLGETIEEAERFLCLPPSLRAPEATARPVGRRSRQTMIKSASRIFANAEPLDATLAANYLHARGIGRLIDLPALRFHPACHYKPAETDEPRIPKAFPALIGSVTGCDGRQTGIHRTFLSPDGPTAAHDGKAQVVSPRRSLGSIFGNAVRFGTCKDVLIAGEGIETMLSLREVLPDLPMAAATSSAHLAAILFPPGLRSLYVARDRDAAGDVAFGILTDRAMSAGIELIPLTPALGDFNDDLRQYGSRALGQRVVGQLHGRDRARFPIAKG